MTADITLLMLSAGLIGFVHTLAGPDHYLPFIALHKARNWSMRKTLIITGLCGIGHTGSSIIIGILGIYFGISLQHLEWFEGLRGNWAAWLLFLFGLAYCCWGLYRSWNYPKSHHKHTHLSTERDDQNVHSHRKPWKELSPLLLFLVFVLGPCEPLIPLLMYPSVVGHWAGLLLLSLAFSITTISTMMVIVAILIKGLSFAPRWDTGRYVHLVAGAIIALCGAGILFLGL